MMILMMMMEMWNVILWNSLFDSIFCLNLLPFSFANPILRTNSQIRSIDRSTQWTDEL